MVAEGKAGATEHLLKRCRYCNSMFYPKMIQDLGGCEECGSRSFRIAGAISDEEEKALLSMGYRFDPAQWTDDKSKRWV